MVTTNALLETTGAYARISAKANAQTESGRTNFAHVTNTEIDTVDETQTLSFSDFVDFINPLQHIPIIGTLYREVTGDTIQPSVQVAGDIMYGGLAGGGVLTAITSIMNATIGQESGTPADVQIAQAIFGSDDETEIKTADIQKPQESKVAFGGIMDTAALKDKETPFSVASPLVSVDPPTASSAATAQRPPSFQAADSSLTEDLMRRALDQYKEMALIDQTLSSKNLQ
jgi:hypothetical protein